MLHPRPLAAPGRDLALPAALDAIAAGAAARDAHPAFPADALTALAEAGALSATLPGPGGRPPSFAAEWDLVRAVARADGAVGRIFDGHLNAVERLDALAPEPLRGAELAAVAAGERWLGVWGADPGPGEGPPARLEGPAGALRARGVKVFCSGAGGLHRALVNLRGPDGSGPPRLAYVDVSERVRVDRGWFAGSGMRASESHRVELEGARVLAVLGESGELAREPFFSRDAIRTAATWAGVADTAADAALDALRERDARGDLEALAAGRIIGAREAIGLWLDEAARRADADPGASLADLSISLRDGLAAAARTILDEAARACGSRPFAAGGALDRARRDLELFTLQHRLDPLVARRGARALEEGG